MASILGQLPAPQRAYERPTAGQEGPGTALQAARAVKEPPPYGRRQGFTPRRLDDFGDGASCGGAGGLHQ